MISFDRITALVMARSCECSFCYIQWTGFDMVTSFPSYNNIERIIIGYNFENNTWTIQYYVVSITSIVQNKNINCLMFASKTAWWYNWIQLNSCRNWHDWAPSSWCLRKGCLKKFSTRRSMVLFAINKHWIHLFICVICSLNNFDPDVDIMLNDVSHILINSSPDIYMEDADNCCALKKDTKEYLKSKFWNTQEFKIFLNSESHQDWFVFKNLKTTISHGKQN